MGDNRLKILKESQEQFQNKVGSLRKKPKFWFISITVILLIYLAACIIALPKSNKNVISNDQEPERLTKLRESLNKVKAINDPLVREFTLQQEAKTFNILVNDYRQLFQIYRRNQEVLPDYPIHQWSILEWYTWLFEKVTSKKRSELIRNGFFLAIEKGVLITGSIAFLRWVWEAPQRRKQEQYQAWQIIHLADGKEVSGARIQALEDLNKQKVSLEGLTAEKANLEGIHLEKANLSYANLSYAKLRYANLQGTDLKRANLQETDLQDANLTNANLIGANLTEASLHDANLTEAKLTNAKLDGVWLSRANLTGVKLQRAKLTNASLDEADLSGAWLHRANLTNANLNGASLAEGRLHEAKLCRAELYEADLTKADLWKADLSGANLSGANLSGADLSEADLSGANLSGADLSGAKNLIAEQIKNVAKNWEYAKYDKNFRKELGLPPQQ
ncbi:pentapeptide repeat-containing protein (plasmid) [Nostoc sp. C057]|uniref:pentapeptide repeat-containing protein n=1 Tax=Nostoc sp. C057 TaxID=2576903 RepID=UPI0015C36B3E|nr:pentapeptide repeat-containing protein [Nostoc sp. C057]QLE54035.1 pentapeptide repeat-containing protein [Nostoc sp. C057]